MQASDPCFTGLFIPELKTKHTPKIALPSVDNVQKYTHSRDFCENPFRRIQFGVKHRVLRAPSPPSGRMACRATVKAVRKSTPDFKQDQGDERRPGYLFCLMLTLALVGWNGRVFGGNPFVAPTLPVIPPRQFNILDYGALGDGVATNTDPLQAAIAAADLAGGGTVEIPRGTFLCGPIHLASGVRLKLDDGAILRMLPLGQYPGGSRNPQSFISATKLHDIAISGKGTIDGQGSPWWPLARQHGARRPRMISVASCERVLLENVRLINSPMFHISMNGVKNVTVRGVIIQAPASTDPVDPSHNTDACDISGRNVLVQDCDVSVGDDDFTCGGGTSNVLITHCRYGNGHGVSIGSPTRGGVSNLTVTDCTFQNTDCGIRIKSDRDRGGFLHDLTYKNLRMTHVGIPILIYASYMASGREYRNLQSITPQIAAGYPSAPVTGLTPVYRDIVFSNITATTQSGSRAGLIWGLPEMSISNVLLADVHIHADRPFGIFDAQNVRLSGTQILTPEGMNHLALGNAQVSQIQP